MRFLCPFDTYVYNIAFQINTMFFLFLAGAYLYK